MMEDPQFKGIRGSKYLWIAHNMIDCELQTWLVSLDDAQRWAADIGAVIVPMSTKTGQGCGQDLGAQIAKQVWDPMRVLYTI